MKKIIFTLFFTTLSFAQSEIDIKRINLWPRISVNAKIPESSFGLFALADMQYNLDYAKEVNGEVKDEESRDLQRNDYILGPSWGTKLGGQMPFSIKLLYRGSNFNPSEVVEDSYFRHSTELRFDLLQPFESFKLKYRLIAWNLYSGSTGEGLDFDNEMVTRILMGVSIPIANHFEFLLDEEVFIKATADKSDIDGTEIFQKNAVWTGVQYNATKWFSFKLQYVNMLYFKSDMKRMQVDVLDHFIMGQFMFKI